MYKCSHCGASMPVPMSKCPNCGVMLLSVKCNACGYVGSKTEFENNENRCPKCNTVSNLFGGASGFANCRKCGKRFGSGDRYCATCGTIRWIKLWPGVIGSGAVALLYAYIFHLMISDPDASDPGFRIVTGCLGFGVLVWLVFEIIKMFRTILSQDRLHLKRGARKLNQP